MKTTTGKSEPGYEAPVGRQELQDRAEISLIQRIVASVCLLVFVAIFPVYAEEAQAPVELQALPEEIAAQFNTRLETIDDLKEQAHET